MFRKERDRMKSALGFTLLSFIVYLFIFSTLAFMSCHLISNLIIPALASIRQYQSLMTLYVAGDFFVHDVRNLSHNKQYLKKIDAQELVWHSGSSTDNKNIGWRFRDNKLERIEGVFDDQWISTKTHIVATGIVSGSFTLTHNNRFYPLISAVITPQADPGHTITVCVALWNDV